MPSFQPGTHVGGCLILRHIATGDVAEVYEVIDPKRVRRALKMLEREVPLDSARQHRFALGGEVTAMVEHVNVVRFIDIGIHENRIWILLDLVEGTDLRTLMQEQGGALPVERAVSLIRQACEGLLVVHKQDIIHRDLKPENILITRDDIAKVTGFGSARLPGWGPKTTTTQKTSSARYMAPEYIKHRTVGEKMDVYALAVILYEVISGKNPIMPKPAALMTIIEAQLDYEPPPLAAVVPDVPGDLSYLLRWAMVKDPTNRCTMREFVDQLDLVQGRLLARRRAAARSVPLPNREQALALTEPAMPAWRSHEPTTTPSVASVPASVLGGTIRMPAAGAPIPEVPAAGAARLASDPFGRDQRRDAVLPPDAPRASSYAAVPTTGRGTEIMAVSSQGPRPPAASVRTEAMSAVGLSVDAISSPAERRSTNAPVESVARPSRTARARPVLVGVGVLILLGLAAASWLLFGSAPALPDRAPAPAASLPPPAPTPATSTTASPSARPPRARPPQRPK